MQPWKISAGLTAALAGATFLLAGSRLEYLAPHWATHPRPPRRFRSGCTRRSLW